MDEVLGLGLLGSVPTSCLRFLFRVVHLGDIRAAFSLVRLPVGTVCTGLLSAISLPSLVERHVGAVTERGDLTGRPLPRVHLSFSQE